MKNNEETINLELQRLKQSVLDVSQAVQNKKKEPYSFQNRLEEKLKNKSLNEYDSNKQIDILQAGEYLKLLCHQKKCLTQKRADKVQQMNQALHIQQEDFRYLFMVSTQANYYKLQYPGYYQRLLEQVSQYPKHMFNTIQKDIPRTLMNEHPFQSSLRNVLVAFAIRNPNLFYCQGMNYLVAYFLINNISEEETFWILVRLTENILPDDYFKDLSTISITAQIFSDVLPYLFPQLNKQIKQIGMDCSLFIVSWYVCLFTKGFINSVSSYLLVRLILQKRNCSFGFVILRLSLGIIATILGRDEPFTFRRQFSAFRDRLQMSVFQISLLQIKLGIQYIQLNEQNYLKLQKYYRQKREQKHITTIQKDMKNKKFALPKCNTDYPICLQRIQIQKRIGDVEEVSITKNGYSIMSQYIEDYFDFQPRKQSNCNIYQQINDCLMFRQKHICDEDLQECSQKNLEQKLKNRMQLKNEQQRIQQQQLGLYTNDMSSLQMKSRVSRTDSKFIELSGLFVVDQKFRFGDQQVLEEQTDSFEDRHLDPEVGSKKSIQQPFNLAEQLEKNNIKQDWIKNEDQYIDLSYFQKVQASKKNQLLYSKEVGSNNVQQKMSENQLAQRFQQKKDQSLGLKQKQNYFTSGQKIWNYFGRTWKKVLKIKEQQLKN